MQATFFHFLLSIYEGNIEDEFCERSQPYVKYEAYKAYDAYQGKPWPPYSTQQYFDNS